MKWKFAAGSLTPPPTISPCRPANITVGEKTYVVEWLPHLHCLQVIDAEGVEKRVRVRAAGCLRGQGASHVEVAVELIVGKDAATCADFSLTPNVPGQQARSAAAASSGAIVKSQLTGKVLQVLVENGQSVEVGQPLVVIEAMKMENKVLAPISGLIANMAAQQAMPITTGAVICKIVPQM